MYEKRRDWEKLLGLDAARGRAPPEGDERAREVPRDREARHRARQEARGLHRALARGARQRSGERRGARRARAVSTSARKDFDRRSPTSSRSRPRSRSTTRRRSRSSAKLGTIYGDRLNNDEGAVNAWRALLALNPNDRKAQEALKKKYLALGRWDDLEVFYAESGKWDEFIRVLEQQEAKETDDRGQDRPALEDRRALGGHRSRSTIARRAPTRRSSSSTPSTSRAAEALIPIYTQAGNAKGLANAIEVKLAHEEDAVREARALLREVAASTRRKAQGAAEGVRALPRRRSSSPRGRAVASTTSSAPRKRDRRWDERHRRLPHGDRARPTSDGRRVARDRAAPPARSRARRRGEAASTRRSRSSAPSTRPTARTPRRIGALERLYRETGRFAELSGSTRRSAISSTEPDERKQILYAIAELYESELKDSTSAIDDLPPGARGRADGRAGARGARRALPRAGALGAVRRRPAQAHRARRRRGRAHRPQVPPRAARSRSTSDDAAGALENYREILFLDPAQRRGARWRSRRCSRTRTSAPKRRRSSRRSTRSAATGRSSSSALEILGAGRGRHRRARRAPPQGRAHRAETLNDLARAFEAQARGAQGRSVARRDARASSSSSPSRPSAWDKLDVIFERDRRGPHRRAARARVLDAPRAHRRAARQHRRGGEGLHARPLARSGRRRGARRAGRALPAHRALDAISSASTGAASSSPHDADRARAALRADGRGLRRAARHARRTRSPRTARSSSSTTTSQVALARARRALHAPAHVGGARREPRGAARARGRRRGADRAHAPPRGAARDRRWARSSRRSRATARSSSATPRTPRRSPRSSASGRTPSTSSPSPTSSSRSTARSGDYQKLIGVHEVQVRRSDDADPPVELLHQIAQLYEDAAGDLSSAFDTLARALERGSGERADAAGSSIASPARPAASPISRSVFETLARAADRRRARERALHDERARLRGRPRRRRQRRSALYRKVLEIDPRQPRRGRVARAPLPRRRALPRAVAILQRKAEILDELAEKKDALFQAARIEEDVLEQPEAAIAVYSKVLELDADDLRALDALIKLYLGLSRWEDLLARLHEEGRSRRRPRREEAHLLPGRRGLRARARRRRAGDRHVPRRSSSSIPTTSRRSRASTSSTSRRRTGRSSSACSRARARCATTRTRRSASSTGSRSSTRSTSTTSPRAIELYREILQRRADHEPTLARPRRAEERRAGSARRRRGPRAGLRGDAAIGRSSSASSRSRSAHADDPFHEGRPAPPHRAPLRGRARRTTRRVRHVRARARARQRQRGDARRTSSASR